MDVVTLAAAKADAATKYGLVSTIEFYGHSYVEGQSVKANRWTTKLARELGAREINRGITGSAIGDNTRVASWPYLLQWVGTAGNYATDIAGPPYHLPRRDVVCIFTGINDLNTRDIRADLTAAAPITEAFKAVIARYRAGSIREESDSTIVFSGFSAAATTNPPRNSGANYRYASANGSTATITLPADFPAGASVVIGLTAEQGAGGTWTFTKNGSAAGSVVALNPSSANGHMPFIHRITGCQPGDVIVGTTSAITTETIFDYWQTVAASDTGTRVKPPLILVFKQPQPYTYTAYPSGLVNDASVANLNTAIQNAVDYFASSSVVAIDMSDVDKARWFFATSDDLHPSDEGHSYLAAKAKLAIMQRAALVPGPLAQIAPQKTPYNGHRGVLAPTCRGWYQGALTVAAATGYAARVVVERAMAVANVVFNVSTAASVDDPVEIAIYDKAGAKIYTTGAVPGKLNSTGIKTVAMGANAILKADEPYYAVLSCATVGGTAAVLGRADFTTGNNGALFGSTWPEVEAGSFTGATNPLQGTLPTITAGNTISLVLTEV